MHILVYIYIHLPSNGLLNKAIDAVAGINVGILKILTCLPCNTSVIAIYPNRCFNNGVLYLITRSLTLREERRLGVFENRMLGRIFGPKRGVQKTT
jgi:hypothetical protein